MRPIKFRAKPYSGGHYVYGDLLHFKEYPNAIVNVIEFDPDKWKKTFNPIRKAREAAGMSIRELSILLSAPYRTVQNWDNGTRKPPAWLSKLIVEKIESAI